jgi:outer membrane protein assembly factor BamA
MMRAGVWLLVVAGLLAGRVAEARQTVDELLGRTVTAIRFEVEGRDATTPALMSLSDVHVGLALRQEDLRSTIGHLDALGRYENVIPVATPVDAGVEVVFRLAPRHPVTALDVRGDTGVPANTLKSQLLQRYGGVPTTVRIPAIEAMAEQLLQDDGYLQAAVTGRTELVHDPESATLVLDVSAGPQAVIEHAVVRGTSPFTPAAIIQRVGATPGRPFRRLAIETSVTAIEDDLRGRGFYEAQVTLVPTPTPTGVDLAIEVDSGPHVELRVDPAGSLPGDLDDLVPIKRLGAADQDLLEDSRARIEAALRADGYWRAAAPFTRELSPDGQLLTITFTITRGARYIVDHVEWPSNLTLAPSLLRDEVGIRSGDVFDESRFLAGLARVADVYRRNGYYKVQIEPSYEERPEVSSPARALVVLHPNITEGPRGEIVAVTFTFEGLHRVPEAELRQTMQQRVGQPYVELAATEDRTALRTHYRNLGYRSAFVDLVASTANDGRDVSLNVHVSEGAQVLIGQITVVGNQGVSTQAILDELGLHPGEPAGDAALIEAQRRLVEMGVFRRVSIPSIDQFTGETEARLIVNVVEAPATTIGYGGGLEGGRQLRSAVGGGFEDYLGFAPSGFFEVGRRNLGGRNRSLNLFSRVSLKRRDAPDDPLRDGRGFGFTEYRVSGTYRERHAFGSNTDLLIGTTLEQARRTNFNFLRKNASAEALRTLSPRITVSGRYALDFTRLFDERIADTDPLQPLIDRLFPQVRLSMLSSGVSWDRRDSPLATTRGTLATADLEVAARAIGSEVGYAKVFLQGAAFHALDARKRTVLAGRVEVGAARGFPRTVARLDESGQPVLDEHGQPVVDRVQDLPASQRFFAGGSTTVRGFQLDRLGVPEILTADGLSLGGNALVVMNAEVRRAVAHLFGRSVSAVGFVDAGNVFATASTLDFRRLRTTTGFGVRYDSPLGPIRLDFGFKVRPQIVGGQRERSWEYHLSIGEAF